MKKTDKTYTFKVTIEGLTLQDIIEILAMKGDELPEEVTILLRETKWSRDELINKIQNGEFTNEEMTLLLKKAIEIVGKNC